MGLFLLLQKSYRATPFKNISLQYMLRPQEANEHPPKISAPSVDGREGCPQNLGRQEARLLPNRHID